MNTFEIGNFIRQLRLERHYTQRRLAEILNISYKEIQSWEDGQKVPSNELFQELSLLFEVTIGELRQGHRDEEVDPVEELVQQVVLRILVYTGLTFLLFGISLFLFATREFIYHIVFVLFGTLFLRIFVFRLQPKNKVKQYFLVFGLLLVISGIFMLINPGRMFVLREERIVLTEYKKHLYLGELGYGTEIVIVYSEVDDMMAIAYTEEQEDFAVIPLTDFQSKDIITIDTNGEQVLDVVRSQDKVLFSTIKVGDSTLYTIYQLNTTDFTGTVIYQSEDVYKLYGSWSGFYMWDHPHFTDQDHTIISMLLYDWSTIHLRTIPHTVWDMMEYDWEHTTRTLVSMTNDTVVNGLQHHQVLMYDNSFMNPGELVIADVSDPLWFDQEWKKAFAYNENVMYSIVENDVTKVRKVNGFYDFNVIHEGLYYGDHAFYNENFQVIQEDVVYDRNYHKQYVGAEVFSDENNNVYILDNEFMGFALDYPDEPYIWTLPLEYRTSYMILSTISLGFMIQAGQLYYQYNQEKKSKELEAVS